MEFCIFLKHDLGRTIPQSSRRDTNLLSPKAWNGGSEITCKSQIKSCFNTSWVILGKFKGYFIWVIRALDSYFQLFLNFSNPWGLKVKVPTGPPSSLPLASSMDCSTLSTTASYSYSRTKPPLPQSLHTCSSLP